LHSAWLPLLGGCLEFQPPLFCVSWCWCHLCELLILYDTKLGLGMRDSRGDTSKEEDFWWQEVPIPNSCRIFRFWKTGRSASNLGRNWSDLASGPGRGVIWVGVKIFWKVLTHRGVKGDMWHQWDHRWGGVSMPPSHPHFLLLR
jgi:hypothetical protein